MNNIIQNENQEYELPPPFDEPNNELIINNRDVVEKAKFLRDTMQYEFEKYKQLLELADIDYKNKIVNYLKPLYDFTAFYEDAVAWFLNKDKPDNNIGKKESFDHIIDTIKEMFDVPEIEMVRMSSCGFESYGYSFEFKVFDTKFDLTIPNSSRVTISNISHANYGKIKLSYEYQLSCYSVIANSYDLNEIKIAFKQYFFGRAHKPRFNIELISDMIDNNSYVGSKEQKEIEFFLENKLYPVRYKQEMVRLYDKLAIKGIELKCKNRIKKKL